MLTRFTTLIWFKIDSSTIEILRFAFLGTLLLFISSCASGRLDPLKPVGQNAKDIDGIMRLSAWMAIAVGLFVAAAVIAVIFKFRVRPGDDPDELPEQVHGNKKAELTWTLIPVVMLLFLAVATIPSVFRFARQRRRANDPGNWSTVVVAI